MEAASVPCGSCNLCCKKTLVLLLPDMGDDVSSYETKTGNGQHFLAMKPNGDCVYLNEVGCSIHARAPHMCKIFDCRQQHSMYSRDQRRELIRKGFLNKEVLQRGNFLITDQRRLARRGSPHSGLEHMAQSHGISDHLGNADDGENASVLALAQPQCPTGRQLPLPEQPAQSNLHPMTLPSPVREERIEA